MFLGRVEGGRISYNSTTVKENTFTAKVKTLGKYGLVLDNVNPVISIGKPIEGKWITAQKELKLSIYDALSGIKSYNAYLNDQWILMEYDYKTKKLVHNLDDNICVPGRNDLKIVVTDNLQNSTTFESYFFR